MKKKEDTMIKKLGGIKLIIGILLIFFTTQSIYAIDTVSISSGEYEFAFDKDSSDLYDIQVIKGSTLLYKQENPIFAFVKVGTTEQIFSGKYSSVSKLGNTITCTGNITTTNDSILNFTDIYTTLGSNGEFKMSRSVTVTQKGILDDGFATKFSLDPESNVSMTDIDVFAPGNWYKQNENVVAGSFASDYTDENFFIKETRLPLPLFMKYNKITGETITFSHVDGDLKTSQSDMTTSWLVDSGFEFGSLGIKKSPVPSINYIYPSYEGDINYYGNGPNGENKLTGMIKRSHPFDTNLTTHQYSLAICLGDYVDFFNAQSSIWEYFFDYFSPQVKNIDVGVLYDNGVDYYETYYRNDFASGAKGLPWSIWTLNSGAREYHLQSGFVGQQTKVGYQLIRDGYENNNTSNITRGREIIDFWVNNSKNASGIHKTDFFSEDGWWDNGPVFLRTASDACEGILDAIRIMADQGVVYQSWIDYVVSYGDFLVNMQNADGSWARSYNQNGTVSNSGKYNTTNPIRFLVKLHLVTGDTDYRDAAIAAGNWSVTNIVDEFSFAGGTPDNDNTLDKEAGMLALNAFNSLYDLTSESIWLDAAVESAYYLESWTYIQDFDIYPSSRWAANGNVYPSWLKVDLGAQTVIDRAEIMFEFGRTYYQYIIETSVDDVNWTTFSDKTAQTERANAMSYIEDGTNTTARYVRITMTGVEGGSSWPSIYEFRVYDENGEDVSQGKNATASSEQNAEHSAAQAVDYVNITKTNSPWPNSGIVGQSLVATGHSYTDTYMIAAPAEFYRLYLFTGNDHFLEFAQIVEKNSNAPADYDGRLGYQHRSSLGEGVVANNFSVLFGEECLTWQIGVLLDSICTLEDLFGYKSISDIEANVSNKSTLNDLSNIYLHIDYDSPVDVILDNSVYIIKNRNSGKLIDVQGASQSNSANIWQYSDIGTDGQKWKAIDTGDGYWIFENVNSGKVMDVEGFSLLNGANISQYQNNNTSNQHWQLVGIGGGYWKIRNRNSGKVVDVEAFSMDDGANISQYQDNNTTNQHWEFYLVNN